MRDALYATFAANLGINSRELAELGGFSERFARDLLAVRRPFPADVKEALNDLQDDIDVLADDIEGWIDEEVAFIHMYADTAALRKNRPDIPGRGKAEGGFIGPYRIAALTALDTLKQRGIDVDILLLDA